MTPIARFLTEFHPVVGTSGWPAATHPRSDLSGGDDRSDCIGLEEQLARARQDGVLEGQRAAEVAALAARTELDAAREADYAARLDAARQAWVDEQAIVLAQRLRIGLADIENRLADSLVSILRPFLDEAIRITTVADLKLTIGSLLTSGTERLIEVDGPADVIAALEKSYGAMPTIAFRVSDSPEVTVVADPTSIVTHLGAWAARLDASLRDAA